MSKTQAARTFDVSHSSDKRYVNKVVRGESLAPKNSLDSSRTLGGQATKLLEDDFEERPFVGLKDRCDYIQSVTGL